MHRVQWTNQLTVSDHDFISQLTLPTSDQAQVNKALKNKNLDQAKRIVAQYFLHRGNAHWPFYMHGTAWMEKDGRGKVLDKAKGLLKNIFKDSWPPYPRVNVNNKKGKWDWQIARKHTGISSVSRMSCIPELSTAYALTGKTAYAHKAKELSYSFVQALPFILEDGFEHDHDRYFGGPSNDTLAVTYRIFRLTDLLHSGVAHNRDVYNDADVFWLVKQIWFLSLQFSPLIGDEMRQDNHHLVDHGHLMFNVGAIFPEFKHSKKMLPYGRKVILHHFKTNVFKDGGCTEHSLQYQYHCSYHYFHPLAVALANKIPLFTKVQQQTLKNWIRFFADTCKPNGVQDEAGDSSGTELTYLFSTLGTPVLDKELAAIGESYGYTAGFMVTTSAAQTAKAVNTFKKDQASYFGMSSYYAKVGKTKSLGKHLPKQPSAHFRKGGFTGFRSAWDKNADYLLVCHNEYSIPHGHAHWDMMSFNYTTNGETLIADPATHLYGDFRYYDPKHAEMRGYTYNMMAHNCLIMNEDPLKTCRAQGHNTFWGGYPPKTKVLKTKLDGAIQFIEMSHQGYDPYTHHRYMIFLPGIGAISIDRITRPKGLGNDLRPHQYTQLYHFEHKVAVNNTLKHEQSLRADLNSSSCTIIPGQESESQWHVERDAWLKDMLGKKQPGPWVASLTRRIQGPTVFSNFILNKSAIGNKKQLQAEYLGSAKGEFTFPLKDGYSAHRLPLGKHGTLLIASCPFKQNLKHDDFSTDADLAVVLLDKQGRIQASLCEKGTQLKVGKKRLKI